MRDLRLKVGRSLLTPSAGRWAAALVAGSALVVLAIGVLFAHQTRADRFDNAVDAPIIIWFGKHPGLAAGLAAPGSLIPAAVLSLAVAVACIYAGRLNGAVLALLVVPASVGLVEYVFKPGFGRTYLGNLAFPSGHTSAVSALAATVALLLLAPGRPVGARVFRVVIAALSVLICFIVVVAVIGLRWHYFTDTVGGAAVGIGTVGALALILDLPTVRSWLSRFACAVSYLEASDPRHRNQR